jgi:Secretion system C-terminal sorting domain
MKTTQSNFPMLISICFLSIMLFSWNSKANIQDGRMEEIKSMNLSNPNASFNGQIDFGTTDALNISEEGELVLDPPTNLEASVENNNVTLSWDSPSGGSATQEWLSFNDGTFENSINSPLGGSGLAQLFELPVYPANLKKVRFYVSSDQFMDPQMEVNILSADGMSVLSGPYYIDCIQDSWTEIEVEVLINAASFMVATYNTYSSGPSVGIDEHNFNNMLYFGNHLTGFSLLSYSGFYGDGSHEAFIEYYANRGESEFGILKPVKNKICNNNDEPFKDSGLASGNITNEDKNSLALLGYNVYRNGDKINQTILESADYFDFALSPGTYNYTVTAVYSEGESSPTLPLEVNVTGSVLEVPLNLIASNQDQNVVLDWYPPWGGGTNTELLFYDNNYSYDAYQHPNITMSTHMSPEGPCKVLEIQFLTYAYSRENNFKARIFNWEGNQPGNVLLFEKDLEAKFKDWVVVDVSANNIFIDGDFLLGFYSDDPLTSIAYDINLNNGRSYNYNEETTSWSSWDEAYLIRALVEYEDKSIANIGISSNDLSQRTKQNSNAVEGDIGRNDMVLEGYNVYRNDVFLDFTENTNYSDILPLYGTYTYEVTANYSEGESLAVGPVSVTWNSGFGIDENELSQNISLAPNPAKDQVFISSPEIINEIKVFNMQSEVMKHELIHKKTFKVNVEKLKAGIYFMYLHSNKSVAVKKFVVN